MTLPAPQARLEKLNSATAAFADNRVDDACRLLEDLVRQDPQDGEALEALAYAMARKEAFAEAAALFDRAVAIRPPSGNLLRDAALVNKRAGRHEQALAYFQKAYALAPSQLGYVGEIADLMVLLDRKQDALAVVKRAQAFATQSPALYYTLGKVQGSLNLYQDELASYQRAISLSPDFVDAHVNAGVALRDMGKFDDAMRSFRKAIAIDTDHAGARTNRAQTNLLLGKYEHGWRDYEWRWLDGKQSHSFDGKPWLGDRDIAGKTLLVHNEQGYGDTIQFIRYIRGLEKTQAKIILRVQAALLPLLRDLSGVSRVIADTDPVPEYDEHIPLMSLPLALLSTFPAPFSEPRYLHADASLKAAWQARLREAQPDAASKGKRVGIVWSGYVQHVNDANRSIPLGVFKRILNNRDHFVSLQKDLRSEDRATLASTSQIYDAGTALKDFADTGALIENLDLVICVDTAVAHLAGALGIPAWIMLPFMPDWRWGLNRNDSPWYPSVELFRQKTAGDWEGPLNAIRQRLDGLAGS